VETAETGTDADGGRGGKFTRIEREEEDKKNECVFQKGFF
jgi:hypothetical protein